MRRKPGPKTKKGGFMLNNENCQNASTPKEPAIVELIIRSSQTLSEIESLSTAIIGVLKAGKEPPVTGRPEGPSPICLYEELMQQCNRLEEIGVKLRRINIVLQG
jgi:hypothetical protein